MGKFFTEPSMDGEYIDSILSITRKYDATETLSRVFCPEYIGRQDVKRGMLCMLSSPLDTRYHRERIHILLHGYPGCGKTVFLEHLKHNWGAHLSTADPRASSLKGDARRTDLGSQIFRQYSGYPVCLDDIEKMTDVDILRDVMESGYYTITKGGINEEFEAQCRIVGATNDITSLSTAMKSRFDLVYKFEKPSIHDSVAILRDMLRREISGEDKELSVDYLKNHMYVSQCWYPDITDPDTLCEIAEEDMSVYGSGEDGRWLNSILRIARGIARVRLSDIGTDELQVALGMKRLSDSVINENAKY